MTAQMLRHRFVPGLVVALACLGLFGLGRLVAPAAPALALAPVAADDLPEAQVEAVTVAGLQGGRVTVAGKEVAVMVAAGGDYSGRDRADIVASRINRQIADGLDPEDVIVQSDGGLYSIEARGDTLVTVTSVDARALGESARTLARRWAGNLREALGGSRGDDDKDADGAWQPSEPYTDKIVPIVSLLQGTRLGVARINGPRSRVNSAQAVSQFSIDFSNFLEIDLYVPISTKSPGKMLDRVQGVGVTGLGDLRL
ncbi:MAG: hypothetical protein KKI08_13345 [Armatimonadetes bacterium]|nr:hypothetical protein [Armatimonadota bacterium]